MATLEQRRKYEAFVGLFTETANLHEAAMAGMSAEQQGRYMMERIAQAEIVFGLVPNVLRTIGMDLCFIKGEELADTGTLRDRRIEAFRISGMSEAQLLLKVYSNCKAANDWRLNLILTEGMDTLNRIMRICTPAGRGTAFPR